MDDPEVERLASELLTLIKELKTQEMPEVREFVSGWLQIVLRDIQDTLEAAKKEGRETVSFADDEQISAAISALKEILAVLVKYSIRTQREVRVMGHKRETHATEWLLDVLERMKRDTEGFKKQIGVTTKKDKAV